ncbi:hypothetical protein BD779DRAFT_1556274 [Infundibulicybe gibba]|nr:hypothetical protein BD779DRAFT_1556274 [Infundibulicybe gibba]
MVKQEFIPAAIPERRLIRESCSFFPLPANCKKTHNDYQMNRKLFYKRELRKLIAHGLEKTRAFIREDGMVIEWKSPVPVWSDTLEPEVPTTAEHGHLSEDSGAASEALHRSPSLTTSTPSTPDETTGTIKPLAVDFITRYLKAFDTNRASISSAYAKNAVFSYRAISAHPLVRVRPLPEVELFIPKGKSYFRKTRPVQGQNEIAETLSSFGPYRFSHPVNGVVDLVYDIVATPPEAGTDVLLVFNTEVVGAGDHHLAVSHSFVLMRSERFRQPSPLAEDVWPVVAVSHQMIIREHRLDCGVDWSI